MGLRSGGYATVWTTEPISDSVTKCRLSTSKKDKQTGQYETDFSGFVSFVGTLNAKNAAQLKEKDRIKLGDVDVRSKYDPEKRITYYNFTAFSFEPAEKPGTPQQETHTSANNAQPAVLEGEVDEDRLPF